MSRVDAGRVGGSAPGGLGDRLLDADDDRAPNAGAAPRDTSSGGWNGYATGWATLHGGYDPRGAPLVVRGWLRLGYGIARLLAALRVGPNAVTVAGLALSVGVPVAALHGRAWLLLAAALVLLSAVADTVDGSLAVVSAAVSRLGQVYDAVADRLAEVCWLVALWAVGAPAWLAVTCGGLTWLHEYVRARAAAAGMAHIGKVTVGERPTRVLLVLLGLGLAGAAGALGNDGLAKALELGGAELAAGTATVTVASWSVLAVLGLAQLAAAVRRALRR
jgi:phosphatidylglycerophosphate synthase